ATGPAELDAAMAGLPQPLDRNSPSAAVEQHRPADPPAGRGGGMIHVESDEKTTTVFEELKREGRWYLPEQYGLTTWLGEIFIDLRDAVVEAPRTHLKIDAWAGDARVLLPPGVSVSVSGSRTWSSLKVDEGEYEVRGGPHIDLELNGLMSSFKVKVLESGRRIPKSWKWF